MIQVNLLTVHEVATSLRVSQSLVYQLIDQQRLPVHRIGNGRGSLRIAEQDLNAYLETCREGARPAPAKRVHRVRLKNLKI